MAGMGTAIWLMARLCRTVLRYPLLLVAGACFWNLGVLLGVSGILRGDSTGYQWLEFPGYAAIILFVAYTLVASWAVLMFRYRRGEQIYITQWYLLGAFLWFPWLYAAGQLMLFVVPVQGVLHDSKSDRASRLQLSSGDNWFLDVRAFLKLDRNAAARRWTFSRVDDHCQHSCHHPHDDSRRHRWPESSHDHARLFPSDALQPDSALHRVRRDVLHGL